MDAIEKMPGAGQPLPPPSQEVPPVGGELDSAAERLFSKLEVSPDGPNADALTQVDEFRTRYPHNVVAALADHASPANILTTLRIGERLLDIADQKLPEGLRAVYGAADKASIAGMLSSKIPAFVALEGTDSLARLDVIATEHDPVVDVGAYIDFRLKYQDGWPVPIVDPEVITGQRPPGSPFLQETADNAWSQEPWMGAQNRPPEWGDLGQMAAITSQWSREYGLVARKGENGVSLGFVRGTDARVRNESKFDTDGSFVFFHSHPSVATTEYGLTTPLVSMSDITSTIDGFDKGENEYGGYLNVVCENGITLQVDSQRPAHDDSPGWTVESGELKGTVIGTVEPGRIHVDTAVMRQLLDSHEPFAYSLNTGLLPRNPMRVQFVHLPWSYIDTSSVALEDVCFGDGLQKILRSAFPQMEDMPHNLHSALQKVLGPNPKEMKRVDISDPLLAEIWGGQEDEF